MDNSMSSSGNQDTEASLAPKSQENTERNSGFKIKITKKDSRSACDLRVPRDSSPYMVTGATDTQRQIPGFLTGRIHSQPTLERQESNHNVSLDTTVQATESEVPQTPQDSLNNLQNKPQAMTVRPATTTPKHSMARVKKLSSSRTCSIQ